MRTPRGKKTWTRGNTTGEEENRVCENTDLKKEINSGAREHQRDGTLVGTRTGEEKFGRDFPVVATNNPHWLLRDQLNKIL